MTSDDILCILIVICSFYMVNTMYSATRSSTTTAPDKPCFTDGCNGDICTDMEGLMTPCVWNPCSVCYRTFAECKRINGTCSFETKDGFDKCMDICRT